MPLILRLVPRVSCPAIWLGREEWEERFKGNPGELLQVMSDSLAAVIDDAGGLDRMVMGVEFAERAPVREPTLHEVIESYVRQVREGTNGSPKAMARALGVDQTTVYRRGWSRALKLGRKRRREGNINQGGGYDDPGAVAGAGDSRRNGDVCCGSFKGAGGKPDPELDGGRG